MPNLTSRRLIGVTSFRDPDAGTATMSQEELAITPDQVQHRIGLHGDATSARVIVSLDPAVIHYQHRIVNARLAHAYRIAPPRPAEKPTAERRPTMTCPLCGGTREEDTGESRTRCRQCRGAGRVPRP